MRFVLVAIIGMVVQVLLVALLTVGFHMDATVASVLAVLVALGHNFGWHVRWTWRERRPDAWLAKTFARFLAANGLVSIAGTALLVPVLTAAHLFPIAANVVTIGICGLANFLLADRYAFSSKMLSGTT
jgi:putative flippase GtrA